MEIHGTIVRAERGWWAAQVPALEVFTQARTEAGARRMLAAALEDLSGDTGLEVTVTPAEGGQVVIRAARPSHLVALVLRRLRQARGLSLAGVATLLGYRSRTAYARYETAAVAPTLDRLSELLRVLAPQWTLRLSPSSLGASPPGRGARARRRRRVVPARAGAARPGLTPRSAAGGDRGGPGRPDPKSRRDRAGRARPGRPRRR